MRNYKHEDNGNHDQKCSQIRVEEFILQIDNAIHNLSDTAHEKHIVIPSKSSLSSSVLSSDPKSSPTALTSKRTLNTIQEEPDQKIEEEIETETEFRTKRRKVNPDSYNKRAADDNCHDCNGDDSRKISFTEKCDLTSPIGLENQYNELYALLRHGLLGYSSTSPNSNTSTSSTRSISSTSKRYDEKNATNTTSNGGKVVGEKQNVSALLLGPRGQGKSLVLEKCITSLIEESKLKLKHQQKDINDDIGRGKDEYRYSDSVPFRVIRLNGIALRGHDVNVTVREIVRQLSEIASRESYERLCAKKKKKKTKVIIQTNNNHEDSASDADAETSNDDTDHVIHHKLYKILEKESHNLRTRKTNFNNSLAILDEALQTACVDSIPILIIMDELDAFLNLTSSSSKSSSNHNSTGRRLTDASSKKHLLLYHLLDRVAGSGSLISLVSSTSQLSTIGMFEKRVKSRVEGTTKIIYFGRPSSYDELVKIVLKKILCDGETGVTSSSSSPSSLIHELKQTINNILLPNQVLHYANTRNNDMDMDSDERQRKYDKMIIVRDIMKRNFVLGFDIRWFCRVLSIALSLYVDDLLQHQYKHENQNDIDADDVNHNRSTSRNNITIFTIPMFNAEYLIDGLQMMGGTNINSKITNNLSLVSTNTHYPYDDDDNEKDDMTENPRINWLLDLTGPQIAVLISAKRILHRDAQNAELQVSAQIPLTYERMISEYESYFIAQSKSSGPDHFSEHIFFKSFCDLFGVFFMPIKDHAGGGIPLQYQYGKHFCIEKQAFRKVALYVNVDLERELGVALKKNRLDCTSALRDWGHSGCRN